ncbi:MAG: TetR/AcrR family transcriptional regulator [Clostridiales bacterium]|nr:TetR/AcrR family transcriptional regulator [Clostridiales bacterium]MBR6254363.1 TetR/AcrR family transcriptional regulator [Clostridiales bacterium]
MTGKRKNRKKPVSENAHIDNVFRYGNNRQINLVTRESLSIALIYLMNEKDFNKISITELVTRAGVSRTAFYRNYTSKEDLLKQIGSALIARITELNQEERESQSEYDWCLKFFSAIKEHEESFRLFLNAGLTPENLFNRNTFTDVLNLANDRKERYIRIAEEGALGSIINTWFREGMQETPEEMAEMCANLIHKRKNYPG